MDRVEETLNCTDRQYSEMRDKTANLGKTKVLIIHINNKIVLLDLSEHCVTHCVTIFQLLYEEVLSHSSPLETIASKASNMAEHYNTQQEVQQLQSRYSTLKEKAKVHIHMFLLFISAVI